MWCLLLALGAMLPGGPAARVWAQASTAVVTGTERVFVRRGPGTEFPPFASLGRGSLVEVQEMQGEWSRVKTGSGQIGYIHSNFLALPNEAGSAGSGAAPPPEPAAPATPRSDAALLSALTEKNKALEAQLSALQEELSALKNHPVEAAPAPATPVAGPPTASDSEELRTELKRLTAAVEGLQNRTHANLTSSEAPAGAPSAEATERNVSSTALVLGGLGLLLGWLAGAAYGRSQERGRRSRIRF